MADTHTIVIVGGGSGGITVAARLRAADPALDIAIVEPSGTHDYQAIWTLVGAGLFPREISRRNEADYIPEGVTWIRQPAAAFRPDDWCIELADGSQVGYEQLVVAVGIQLRWSAVEGLEGAVGEGNICSNYAYDTVESTARCLRNFEGGTALFTMPKGAMKCGGAPQKIMWLAEEEFRRRGIRDRTNVVFATAGTRIFGVPKYRHALERLVQTRGIDMRTEHDLVRVNPGRNRATFARPDGTQDSIDYDFIHVTPPQGPPPVVANSPLADAGGWVEVDKHTLQHVRHPDVFALGDCSSLPTSKTGAAVRKQAPVLVQNLLARRAHKPLAARYDGYTSCPIVTGRGRLILAEFDYDGNPVESFPFDQAQERYSMYALKAYVLPELYWNGMLRGRA